jgi:tellurite resistance protein TerC
MILEIAILIALVVVFLLVDFVYFGRHGEPTFAEATRWSIFWFVLSLAVAPVMLAIHGSTEAIDYTTVYLIERSLSLDNLFVFLLLFTYFSIPVEKRGGLLFWGIVLALALRGLAILGGTELIEQFHWFLYVLGVGLLILAWRVYKGVDETPDPDQTFAVRFARRIKKDASPVTLALLAMVFADITFAIDSIPAAFAITTDSFVIWTANAFALLGMRALFVLVEGLIERFRYLGQTIAVVLAIIAIKLLIEEWVKVSAPVSLGIIVVAFAVGIGLSLRADRRDAARPA